MYMYMHVVLLKLYTCWSKGSKTAVSKSNFMKHDGTGAADKFVRLLLGTIIL